MWDCLKDIPYSVLSCIFSWVHFPRMPSLFSIFQILSMPQGLLLLWSSHKWLRVSLIFFPSEFPLLLLLSAPLVDYLITFYSVLFIIISSPAILGPHCIFHKLKRWDQMPFKVSSHSDRYIKFFKSTRHFTLSSTDKCLVSD